MVSLSQLAHPLSGARFGSLTATLSKHRGVSIRNLPRILIAYLVIGFRLPNCIVESIRTRQARAYEFRESPVFILGHWRSGTTLLHHLLSMDPAFCYPRLIDVLSPYEFFPSILEKYTHPLIFRQLPATRPMDEVRLDPDFPQEEEFAMAAMGAPSFINCLYFPDDMLGCFESEVLLDRTPTSPATVSWRASYRYFLAKVSLRYGGRRLLLKNPANSGRIEQLRAIFPTAKFIHIHRHPFEVYGSMCRFYEKMLPLLSLQSYDLKAIPALVLDSYREIMTDFLNARSKLLDGDIVEVSFDELRLDPLSTIERIYNGLGLPLSLETRERITAFLRENPVFEPQTKPLAVELAGRVFQHWAEIFSRLGYSNDSERRRGV